MASRYAFGFALRHALAFSIAAIIAWASTARACDVPVFRYALERWPADLYEVDVFFEPELTPEQRAIVSKLEDQALVNGGTVNWEVVQCRVDKPLAADLEAVLTGLNDAPLPQVVLRMPGARRDSKVIWNGPLATVESALWDTAGRRELVRRLLAGDSVVWVILAGKDDAAVRVQQQLREHLPALAEEIPLPPGVGRPGSELLANIPLQVRFSTLMLEGESQLRSIAASHVSEAVTEGETLIVPVFGRGRAMATWRASEFDAETIAEASRFLCGACSCQVKQSNPGYDLLLAVNWEERLYDGSSVATDPPYIAAEEVTYVPIPTGSHAEQQPPTPQSASLSPVPQPSRLSAPGLLIIVLSLVAVCAFVRSAR